MEGLAILEEVPGELGVLLWRSLRNVLLWARGPAGGRAKLFAPLAALHRSDDLGTLAIPSELRDPLSAIGSLLADPDAADPAALIDACRSVAAWGERMGKLATALDFAQGAALVAPDSGALAYTVGRLARLRAEYDRAESWLTRAVIQSRQSRDWPAYGSALAGLGNLHVQRGNLPAARRAHLRCLKASRRFSLGDLQTSALHNLFVTAAEVGARGDAEAYALAALARGRGEGTRHARLAYDVGHLWLLAGDFENALSLQRALLPCFAAPSERMLVLGGIARAAGALGLRGSVDAAGAEIECLVIAGSALDSAARALVGLGHGLGSLGAWNEAGAASARAVEIAAERGEGKVRLEAEALLESVRRGAVAAHSMRLPRTEATQPLLDGLMTELQPAGTSGGGASGPTP